LLLSRPLSCCFQDTQDFTLLYFIVLCGGFGHRSPNPSATKKKKVDQNMLPNLIKLISPVDSAPFVCPLYALIFSAVACGLRSGRLKGARAGATARFFFGCEGFRLRSPELAKSAAKDNTLLCFALLSWLHYDQSIEYPQLAPLLYFAFVAPL
jgi:hypothetical protein